MPKIAVAGVTEVPALGRLRRLQIPLQKLTRRTTVHGEKVLPGSITALTISRKGIAACDEVPNTERETIEVLGRIASAPTPNHGRRSAVIGLHEKRDGKEERAARAVRGRTVKRRRGGPLMATGAMVRIDARKAEMRQ